MWASTQRRIFARGVIYFRFREASPKTPVWALKPDGAVPPRETLAPRCYGGPHRTDLPRVVAEPPVHAVDRVLGRVGRPRGGVSLG